MKLSQALPALVLLELVGQVVFLPGCTDSSATTAHLVRMNPPAAPKPDAGAAGSACPAINFQSLQQLASNNPALYFGLQRQGDGSFTAQYFTINESIQTFVNVQSAANVQQAMVQCAGIGGRTRHAVTPNLKIEPAGSVARPVVTADLLGNGSVALIGFATDLDPGQLLVQLSDLDFASRGPFSHYTVGTLPLGSMLGDFNGDGNNDIAVVYQGSKDGTAFGGVSLLLGHGDGSFSTTVNYPTGLLTVAGTTADFNGDGRADIAVAQASPASVTILLSQSNGTTALGNNYTLNASGAVGAIGSGDLNGDHKADILVLAGSTIYVLYGKGDGAFQNGPSVPVPASGTLGASALGVTDLNGDGIADIVVSDAGPGIVYVLLGTGSGAYSTPVAYTTQPFGAYFFLEDFDGDGNTDIVFAGGHPDALTNPAYLLRIGVLFGNGDGTFAGGAVAPVGGKATDQSQSPTNLVVADFNGDGKPDIATSNPSGNSISVSLGRGGGFFQSPASISLGTVQPNSIATADINGDGHTDLVVTDGVANVDILMGKGDGTFQQPLVVPVAGTKPSSVATGDFNGDKKLDLAIANPGSNNLSILLGNGDGSFRIPFNISAGTNVAVGTNPVSVVVGDFNSDGKADLAVANEGTFSTDGSNIGSIAVLLGKGDGTFQPPVNYPAYQYPVFLTAADVNGDQTLDLIVASRGANGTDQLAVLLGTGSGTFQTAVLTNTASAPFSIAAADFSGDGKMDLVVAHCCQSGALSPLTALQGNGDGTFLSETTVASGSYPAVAAVDLDGNGKPDIVYTNFVPGGPHLAGSYLNISTVPGALTITSAAGNPLKLPPVAPYSIVTAKGSDLANGTLVNAATTPPTILQGTTITVQDSAGVSRPAQIFYVSPGQVNFLMPQATAAGNATVTITAGDAHSSAGTVAVTPVAPSVFTLNTNSLVAAYIQRVHGDGTQSIENIYAVDAAGNVTFPPIDLGPATDQVYLNLYGTGIQGRSSVNAVVITVGGLSVVPLYAGPSTFPGEDQVTILLPHSLTGAGTVNLTLTADGKSANSTTLNIK